MATKTVYSCDKCGSVDKDEDYRSDVSNFSTLTLTVNTKESDPMLSNKSESIQICNDCIDEVLTDMRVYFKNRI